MQREQRIARKLAVGTAVALTGTLYAAFGWVDVVAFAAILAGLRGLYPMLSAAFRALARDGRSRPAGGAEREAGAVGHVPLTFRRLPLVGG